MKKVKITIKAYNKTYDYHIKAKSWLDVENQIIKIINNENFDFVYYIIVLVEGSKTCYLWSQKNGLRKK